MTRQVHGWAGDEPSLPDISELTGQPGDPHATMAEVRHTLGIGVRRVRFQPPDMGDLADELGLD